MDFRSLAERMEAVEATPRRLEMAQRLADIFEAADDEETARIAYLLLGNLAPEFEGLEVGLAENRVRELISTRTGADEDEIADLMAELGDLGDVAEHLWETSAGGQRALDAFAASQDEEGLSVLEVHGKLAEIARVEGEGSQEKRMRHALRLLDRASPVEARYLVRFLVGTMRLGVADQTLLDGAAIAFAPEGEVEEGDDGLPRPPEGFRESLERAYNLTSDIGAVVERARDEGREGLDRVEITPGLPVRPMLAERGKDAVEIFENVGSPALAEYKYDGLRIQAHVTDEGTRLFSRRLEDVTQPYPDVVENLQAALEAPAVVEGEAVPVDPETGEIQPFQQIAKRRGRKHDLGEAIEAVPIRLYLFDCLWTDGEDLTRAPLETRRDRLADVLGDHEAVLPSHAREVEAPGDLDAFFQQAVDEGSEGLMVKKLGEDSHYQAGARGYRWIKYKADYQAELADSMDLVVVGAWHGKGRRAGWYGTLLGAAWDEDEDRFKTVCKVGTGFTDEDLQELEERLGPHEVPEPSDQLDLELEPDVHVAPAVVAEIHGADLTRSPVHTAAEDEEGGIALRFPRFVRWRPDKGPGDATTVDEVESMYYDQPGVERGD